MALLLHHTETLAKHQGWQKFTVRNVRYVLNGLAGCHEPGETIKASTVQALTELKVPTRRVLEVLSLVEGLLVDDRPDALTRHIDAQFAELSTPMRQELQVWIDMLRHGGPRCRAHPEMTTRTRLLLRPPLPARGGHPVPDAAPGHRRRREHLARVLPPPRGHPRRATRSVSCAEDPAAGVHQPHAAGSTTPAATSTSPAHSARRYSNRSGTLPKTIPYCGSWSSLSACMPSHPSKSAACSSTTSIYRTAELHLNGTERSLDPFSAGAINDYFSYRHHRWPHTSNPHLLVTSISANDHSTVSPPWLCNLFRDLPATPNQLRQDRILEEARATGADPLHLAAMFDFAADTGLRYASAVTPEPAPRGL